MQHRIRNKLITKHQWPWLLRPVEDTPHLPIKKTLSVQRGRQLEITSNRGQCCCQSWFCHCTTYQATTATGGGGNSTKRLRIYLAMLSFHCVSSCLAGEHQPPAVGFVHTQPLLSLSNSLRLTCEHLNLVCVQKNGRISCKQRRKRENVFFRPGLAGNKRHSTQSAFCNNNTTTPSPGWLSKH